MFFISRKRFDELVEERVCEEIAHIEERRWHENMEQEMQELSGRVSIIEKALTGEAPVEEMARIGFQ